MENNLKKTVVLDYYGIPGSGKSTTSHALAEKYREEGKSVIEPSYNYDHHGSGITRKLRKLAVTILFGVRSPRRFVSVYRLGKLNGYTLSSGLFNQMVNIITKIYAIEQYNEHYDYIIFDEGLVQAAISLSINSERFCGENLTDLYTLVSELEHFNPMIVVLDIEEALRRIEIRNSKDTRVEALDSPEHRYKLMEKYNNLVYDIYDFFHENGI